MYSIPMAPNDWMAALSLTQFNTDGPIAMPANINPTMAGMCILRHITGTNSIIPSTKAVSTSELVIIFV